MAERALGIIPARGGSKSVPRKNLRVLLGQPLIVWSILSAQKSKRLDRVIVSTDDQEIAEVARHYGVEVPFLRPAELAADDTPDLPVLQHALSVLRDDEGYVPDVVVHLRPTQPLRTPEEIDQAVELWASSGADCVKSVVPVREHPFKMYRMLHDRLRPYRTDEERKRRGPDVPRQSLPLLYLAAGVVDVISRAVVEAGSTEGEWVIPYFVDPTRYVNLDSEHDFLIAELLGSGGGVLCWGNAHAPR